MRGSNIVPALISVLQTGSVEAKAGAAGALANLSCESQSVRLIRRSSGILPLLDLVQCVSIHLPWPFMAVHLHLHDCSAAKLVSSSYSAHIATCDPLAV